MTEIDEFTEAYIEAALWSSNDESTEQGGEPLDRNYSTDDIAPDTLEQMIVDCRRFQYDNHDDIQGWGNSKYSPEEMAGHDFWLTRNGHGAGFWDGDWSKPESDRLTKASTAFGEFDLYVGDDGKIHGSPL